MAMAISRKHIKILIFVFALVFSAIYFYSVNGGCNGMSCLWKLDNTNRSRSLLFNFYAGMSENAFKEELLLSGASLTETSNEGILIVESEKFCFEKYPCVVLYGTFSNGVLGRVTIEIPKGSEKNFEQLKDRVHADEIEKRKTYFILNENGPSKIWSEDVEISSEFKGND